MGTHKSAYALPAELLWNIQIEQMYINNKYSSVYIMCVSVVMRVMQQVLQGLDPSSGLLQCSSRAGTQAPQLELQRKLAWLRMS